MNRVAVGFLLLLLAPSPSSAQPEIGVASVVKNSVTAASSGRARPIATGNKLYANETVSTGEQAVAQLLFLDETSLSIGPRSEVTLDKFVYDPGRGTGQMTLSASRGALRFISGSMESRSYQIRTPVATLGVRGTIFDVLIRRTASGQVSVSLILIEGATVATFGGKQFNLSKPGQALTFGPRGVQQVSYDGILAAVQDRVPFPLFGNTRIGADRIDDLVDRLDQLYGTAPPPPPPPPTLN
jgi:ferric-dicitrate binding protein FerR (iron transport regulator)